MRIIGIDVPGFGVPTHAEAKDVLAGAMLEYARKEAEQGPVQAPRGGRSERPTVTLLGEMFPADPVGIGMMLEPLGLAAGPVVPTREWRELYAALDCAAVAAIHPFYTASLPRIRSGRPHDRRLRAGRASTARPPGSTRSARPAASSRDKIDAAQEPLPARDHGARSATKPIKGRITLSGYEGSELLVARLLIESGADVPLCRHRLPAHAAGRMPDREWLEAQGRRACSTAPRSSRTSPRCDEFEPGPRHRHDAGGAEGEAAWRSRRSISPT